MPSKYKVGSSNHHMIPAFKIQYKQIHYYPGMLPEPRNTCLSKVSRVEKYLAGKGILGRKISAQERFLGTVLFLQGILGR